MLKNQKELILATSLRLAPLSTENCTPYLPVDWLDSGEPVILFSQPLVIF